MKKYGQLWVYYRKQGKKRMARYFGTMHYQDALIKMDEAINAGYVAEIRQLIGNTKTLNWTEKKVVTISNNGAVDIDEMFLGQLKEGMYK